MTQRKEKRLANLIDNLKSQIEDKSDNLESAIDTSNSEPKIAFSKETEEFIEYSEKHFKNLGDSADPKKTCEDITSSYRAYKQISLIYEDIKKEGIAITLEDEKRIFDYVVANPIQAGMIPIIYVEELISVLNLSKNYQPRALVNDLNHMVGGSAITSATKALRDPHWGKNSLGKACYVHKKADNSNSYITHYIQDFKNLDEIALLPHSEAIQILDKFGVYPALLHLILAVHFYKQINPNTAYLQLKGTDLIKDLGLDNRTDLTKEQKLERVIEVITAVKSLIITAKWSSEVSVKRGKKFVKKQLSFEVDPCIMWNIATAKITQKDLFGNEELLDIDVRVKAGAWLTYFFDRGGRELGEALYNFATLSRKILDLDPYHEELALRIALLQSTMDYRQYYTVEQWLIENLLGAKTKISEAKLDKYTRRNLTKLWDNTLKALERIGFEINYDNNTYPEELRPNFEGKKPRGYFERLLEAKIKLTPESLGKPQSDQDAIEAEKIPITPVKSYRGEDLKKARLKANVSPKQIANYLKCSQGKIYNAEKRDNLSEKLFKEIISAVRYISKNPYKYPKY